MVDLAVSVTVVLLAAGVLTTARLVARRVPVACPAPVPAADPRATVRIVRGPAAGGGVVVAFPQHAAFADPLRSMRDHPAFGPRLVNR